MKVDIFYVVCIHYSAFRYALAIPIPGIPTYVLAFYGYIMSISVERNVRAHRKVLILNGVNVMY